MRGVFLGTAAGRPTVSRNVPALLLQREGESFLFDCGEGTQRQMMRYGTGFSVDDIFLTHLHADHFLGVTGLLRTMGLQGRQTPVRLWTPAGTERMLHRAVTLGYERLPFPVEIHGLEPEQRVERTAYTVIAFAVDHHPRVRCLGYAFVEPPRRGRFFPERARALGVPEGPLWGRLAAGEAVEVDGRRIEPRDVLGPPRPGRCVVYSGDTRPCETTRRYAAGADLLIHEATFAQDEAERARLTGHATAAGAARLAAAARVRRLVLTHISPRYADDPRALEREAQLHFPSVQVAHDGLVVEVPYVDAVPEWQDSGGTVGATAP